MIKNFLKNSKLRCAFFMLLGIALCFALTVSVLAEGSYTGNRIDSVKLNKKGTEITVDIRLEDDYVEDNKKTKLYLFEMLPFHSTDELSELTHVKEFTAKEKITVKLPYAADEDNNRLYSRFVVAQKVSDGSYKLITDARYLDNPEILAKNTTEYPACASKKGLIIDRFSDAQLLGVRHTVIDVPVNELMRAEKGDESIKNEQTETLNYAGQKYYVNKMLLSNLRYRIKSYSDSGITVYLNLILTPPTQSTSEKIRNSFYRSDLTHSAKYFAFNTENEYAVNALGALLNELCTKHTAESRENGIIHAIIVGFEANNNRASNSAGPMELESYTEQYAILVRMAYNALRSNYANGRVYVSVGNNWTSKVSDLSLTPDEKLDYGAKEFLDTLNKVIAKSGDIPWGVSINPYPSDPTLVEYWNDTNAENKKDTKFVTMKNIDVLTDYLSDEKLQYNGETRSVIIGEFGISGTPLDAASINTQAAGYALAYYTADKNEHIDAFIYNRQIDSSADNAPYYGILSYSDGSEPTASVMKETMYKVFSLIDTSGSKKETEFVSAAVGDKAFADIMGEKNDYDDFDKRTIITESAVDGDKFKDEYDKNVIYKYKNTEKEKYHGGYYFSDTDIIDLHKDDDGKDVIYALITGVPTTYKGITNITTPEAYKNAQYITLDIKPQAPDGVKSLKLMLYLQSSGDEKKNSVEYRGETVIAANEWSEVSFDLREFIKESGGDVDVMKILICTEDGTAVDGEYGIWLRSTTLYVKKGLPIIVKILIGILIAAAVLVAAYMVLYLRAQIIRKKRREEAERRKREMRRQQLLQIQRRQAQGNLPHPMQPQQNRTAPWPQSRQSVNYQSQQRPPMYPNVQPNGTRIQYPNAKAQTRSQPNNGQRNAGGDTQIFSTEQINRGDRQ